MKKRILSVMLALSLGFSLGAQQDMTSLITNPSYETDASGWEGTSLTVKSGNAQLYSQETFDIYQNISNLTPGVYKINVSGFYRAGNWINDHYGWANGLLSYRLAKVYGTTTTDDLSAPIQALLEGRSLEKLTTGSDEYGLGGDANSGQPDTCYIPNTQADAAVYFKAGKYQENSLLIPVEDGNLRIGVRKNGYFMSDLTILDQWTLTYLGNSMDIYKSWSTNLLATIQTELDKVSGEYAYCYQTAQKELKAQMDVLAAATTQSALHQATSAIYTLAPVVAESIELYDVYAKRVKEIRQELIDSNKDTEERDLLSDYVDESNPMSPSDVFQQGNAAYILENGQLDCHSIKVECEYLEKIYTAYKNSGDGGFTAEQLIAMLQDILGRASGIEGTYEVIAKAEASALVEAKATAETTLSNLQADASATVAAKQAYDALQAAYDAYVHSGDTYAALAALNIPLADAINEFEKTSDPVLRAEADGYQRNMDDGVWPETTEEAEALIERVKYLISALKWPVRHDSTEPVDYTSLIVNPDYSNGTTGWENASTMGIGEGNVGYYAGATYDFYQTINSLPAGTYKLRAQAYYRRGYNTDHRSWVAGDTTSQDYAKMYIKIADQDPMESSVCFLSSGMSLVDLGTDKSYTEEDGTVHYVPWNTNNETKSSANWFEAGYYWNEIEFEIADGQAFTFGMKKGEVISADWFAIKQWRLTYYPKAESNAPVDYTSMIVNPKYENGAEGWDNASTMGIGEGNVGYYAGATYDFHQTINSLPAGTYKMKAQAYYRRGYNTDHRSWVAGDTTSQDYAKMYIQVGNQEPIVNSVCFLSSGMSLVDLGTDKSYTEEDGTVHYVPWNTNNETKSSANWFEAGYYWNEIEFTVEEGQSVTFGMKKDEVISADWFAIKQWTLTYYPQSAATGPADYTSMIVNPEYTNGTEGWDEAGTMGMGEGNVGYYAGATYDFHQTINALPAGDYELQAQAYYRRGYNTDHRNWVAGDSTSQDYAKMYAVVATEEPIEVSVCFLSSGMSLVDLGTDKSYTEEDGTVHYVPWNTNNETKSSANWFEAGYYWNSLHFTISQDGQSVTFGMKKNETISADWFAINRWRLLYHGQNGGETPVELTIENKEIASRQIYSLNGMKLGSPTKGINIVKTTYSDGSVQTTKILVK